MKILESSENYLETILVLSKRLGNVRSIDIVNELDYSKPSVSVAMKKLRKGGYIDIDGDGYITLTNTGLDIAEIMYERHKLLTRWLVHLGVNEETASEDACRIEHIISVETFEAIKEHVSKNIKIDE
ncbi:MAG: metal-dependent transcriptional regulator [Clostridiales bacterium]|nr:metal-dependent transcriptional regulator [Clostridiales bacterium]